MAILTKAAIKERMEKGDIVIQPFNEEQLNPNSYNVTLGNELVIYDEIVIDSKKQNKTVKLTIPESGLVLNPGQLYIASINEYTKTENLVPKIEGRSSLGRLGLFIHITAGYGDVGYAGNFTLELAVIRPLRIYPGMKIAQISYNTIEGEVTEKYNGKYQGITTPQASKLYEDK